MAQDDQQKNKNQPANQSKNSEQNKSGPDAKPRDAKPRDAKPQDIHLMVTQRAGRPTASSGSKWEPKMGYSRAVRTGNFISVSGTVGVNPDGKYPATLADQTRRSLAIIRLAIETLGGKLENVTRTRMYVTDVTKWEEVANVHGELFGEIRPATTLVEVSKLIDGEAQIEIEADAIVS